VQTYSALVGWKLRYARIYDVVKPFSVWLVQWSTSISSSITPNYQ